MKDKLGLFDKMNSDVSKVREKVKDVYNKREEREFVLQLKQNIKEIPNQLPKESIQRRVEHSQERETIRKEEKKLSELKQEVSKIKREAIEKKVDKLSSFGERTLSKPLLKKPSVSVPRYSATKVIQQMGAQQGALVRQVEPRTIVQDNRTQFFRSNMDSEIKSERNWLFKD